MVRISHIFVTASILQLASARAIRPQVPRHSTISASYDAGKQEGTDGALHVERRNLASSTNGGAGYCRKRLVKIPEPGNADAASIESGPGSAPSASACNAGISACLPQSVTDVAISTSYIDITSTIYVTAVPTATGSLNTPSTPISRSSVSGSGSSDALNSKHGLSSSVGTVKPTEKPVHPSEIVSSVPVSASAVPSKCPTGYTWKSMTDDFLAFDEGKWKRELGTDDQITFGQEGLLMKLTEQSPNIVFESKVKWRAPVTMTASIKTAQAGGIVNCAIFGQSGTDEIDLELIENTWQVPMWHNGKRLEKDRDVTWTLADTSREVASWVFEDREVKPFSGLHDWSLHWHEDYITWSVDGKRLLDVRGVGEGSWPDQALPLRWGPWAAPGGWAGQLNWTAQPEPVMQLKKVVIEGCQLDA